LAEFLPSGKIPGIGESPALLRFDVIDEADVALEHDALVVLPIDEREAGPVLTEARVGLGELQQRQAKKLGDPFGLTVLEADVTRPLAAGRATLANVVDVRVAAHVSDQRDTHVLLFGRVIES
jgi:hypothetical protein